MSAIKFWHRNEIKPWNCLSKASTFLSSLQKCDPITGPKSNWRNEKLHGWPFLTLLRITTYYYCYYLLASANWCCLICWGWENNSHFVSPNKFCPDLLQLNVLTRLIWIICFMFLWPGYLLLRWLFNKNIALLSLVINRNTSSANLLPCKDPLQYVLYLKHHIIPTSPTLILNL